MVDKYVNFADLTAHEPTGAYRISKAEPAGAKVAHIAIHGGAIEPGTTQLAFHAADAGIHTYYSFEGIKSSGNSDLHITSTHFDEPQAISLVSGADYTVSWHGAANPTSGATAMTYIGGLDANLAAQIETSLKSVGFVASVTATPPELNANSPGNITNKNSRGMGVQLELTKSQ